MIPIIINQLLNKLEDVLVLNQFIHLAPDARLLMLKAQTSTGGGGSRPELI